MRFDHIGYAVKDIKKAQRKMEVLGYIFEDIIEDDDRNIYLAFGVLDGVRVELVAPLGRGGGFAGGQVSVSNGACSIPHLL